MILSNVEIQKALDDGRLVIHPEPSPRRPPPGGRDCPYSTTAVDLRLGPDISHFEDGRAFAIDLRRGSFSELFGTNAVSYTLTQQQPYVLAPGAMVLGRTLETVTLSLDHSGPLLAGRVEGKSSYARCGLLVHFTAPTIHAGFSGTITLELINLGRYPILLYPGVPICQLIVEEVLGTPFRNDSRFQGQSRPGGVGT